MYRLHNTSEHGSGVTNMYSISNAASRAATPMQMGGGGDQLVMLSGKYYRNTISIKERQEERSKYTFVIYNYCFPMGVLETQLKEHVYGTTSTVEVVTLVI